MIFEYHTTIRESNLDTFGHVNNAAYLQLLEEARWEWINTIGNMTLEQIHQEGIGPVILEVNLKFKKELRNREKIKVTFQMKSQEHSKIFNWYQEIIKENGEVAATCDLVGGVMDLKLRKLIVPPAKWIIR